MFLKTNNATWGYWQTHAYDPDLGLWLWSLPVSGPMDYYISAHVGRPLTINSSPATYPSGYYYNAQDYYVLTGGLPGALGGTGWYLWWSSSYGWVISEFLGYGVAEFQQEDDTWVGDNWWSCDAVTGTFIPRGGIHDEAYSFESAYLPVEGWKRAAADSYFGEYEAVAGSSKTGTKYIGFAVYLATFNYDYGFGEQEYTGYFTQGTDEWPEIGTAYPTFSGVHSRYIWWDGTDGGNWIISSVIGSKSATEGYWSCPTLEGTFTRTYSGTGDAPAPVTYELEFSNYSQTSQSYEIYMIQAPVWAMVSQ